MVFTSRRNTKSNNPVVIEPLESRTYFDLVPIAVIGEPASAITTVKTKSILTVTLQNTGATTIRGAYELITLVSPDGGLGDATVIKIQNEVLPPLKAGATRTVTIPLGTIPADATTGENFVEAEVGGDLVGIGDTFVDSASEILIAAPFVDLSGSVSYSSALSVKPGVTAKETVQITNNGNVPARGPLQIQLGTSLNSDGSAATVFSTPTVHINIAPSATVSEPFVHKIAKGTVPTTYFATANIDPNNTFSETNTANNFAVSSPGLTVLDPFTDISGMLNGPFDIKTGPGKGDTGTLNLDVTSESNTTGDVSGIGSNSFSANYIFSGDVTTTNLVTLNYEDMNTMVTGVLSGRIVNGNIVGTFHQSNAARGTFTLAI